nr:sodium/potassium-transporting ATPase subunit beta-1-interacting protein 4 isoform X2 [Symphalangus syndactylus]
MRKLGTEGMGPTQGRNAHAGTDSDAQGHTGACQAHLGIFLGRAKHTVDAQCLLGGGHGAGVRALASFVKQRSPPWRGRCLTSWATSGRPSWPTSSTSSSSSWDSSAPSNTGRATSWCTRCGQPSGSPGTSSSSASTWKSVASYSELLTFSLSRHRSWWREHWPGCLHEEVPAVGLGAPHGQALVSRAGCALEPSYVEALHSGLQILIALLGFVCGCYVVRVFTEEEDSFDFIGGFDPFPLYHVNEKPSSLLSKPA